MTVAERIKIGKTIKLINENKEFSNLIKVSSNNGFVLNNLSHQIKAERKGVCEMPRQKGDYYIQEGEYMELLEGMETMDADEYEERKSQLWPMFQRKLEEDEQEFADDACGPFWDADGLD